MLLAEPSLQYQVAWQVKFRMPNHDQKLSALCLHQPAIQLHLKI